MIAGGHHGHQEHKQRTTGQTEGTGSREPLDGYIKP